MVVVVVVFLHINDTKQISSSSRLFLFYLEKSKRCIHLSSNFSANNSLRANYRFTGRAAIDSIHRDKMSLSCGYPSFQSAASRVTRAVHRRACNRSRTHTDCGAPVLKSPMRKQVREQARPIKSKVFSRGSNRLLCQRLWGTYGACVAMANELHQLARFTTLRRVCILASFVL